MRFHLLACVLLVYVCAAFAAEKPPLTLIADSPQNRVWADDGRSSVGFDPRKGEPAIVLNKAAFRTGDVQLEIETDAKSLDFSSGGTIMQLRIVPEDKHRLLLNGITGKETLKLANKELVFQKPLWAQIMSEEGGRTFTLFFADATEVKIAFKPRDRSVKLR